MTVREEGIMTLKNSGKAKTLELAMLPSLPGEGASEEAGESSVRADPLDLDRLNPKEGWIRSR